MENFKKEEKSERVKSEEEKNEDNNSIQLMNVLIGIASLQTGTVETEICKKLGVDWFQMHFEIYPDYEVFVQDGDEFINIRVHRNDFTRGLNKNKIRELANFMNRIYDIGDFSEV